MENGGLPFRSSAGIWPALALLCSAACAADVPTSFQARLGESWTAIGEGAAKVEVTPTGRLYLRTEGDLDTAFVCSTPPLTGDYVTEIVVGRLATTRSGGIYLGAFRAGDPTHFAGRVRETAKVIFYPAG